jgi:hypothetical protein
MRPGHSAAKLHGDGNASSREGGNEMMMRRRRPLLRASMVGGVAYQAGKKGQAAAPAPAAPAGGLSDAAIAQLKELAQLKHTGVLTQEEFDEQKRQLLG